MFSRYRVIIVEGAVEWKVFRYVYTYSQCHATHTCSIILTRSHFHLNREMFQGRMLEVTEQFTELTPWEGLKTGNRIMCVFAVDSLLFNTQVLSAFSIYIHIDLLQGGAFLFDGILVIASYSMGSLLFSPLVGKQVQMKEQAAAKILSISVVIAKYLERHPAPDACIGVPRSGDWRKG